MTPLLPQLSIAKSPFVAERAFDGDRLDRQRLATHLGGLIDRLRDGAVLAIDAPWGEGKSWFGQNWAKALRDDGHKVVFVDAFEHDYVEDPFFLLTAEISHALDDGQGARETLNEKAACVLKAILPIGTKALINMAGRLALGSADIAEEFKKVSEAATDDLSDASHKWAEKKLDGFAIEKKSLGHFQKALAQFAAVQEKPVIMFVDELDRCRPTFAIKLIERLKHFFDVPNLIFVLLLNRDQLEQAIKGIYGEQTDSGTYISKFINFFFQLPKKVTVKNFDNGYATEYVRHVFQKYRFGEGNHNDFIWSLASLFTVSDISLRDLEKAVALYAVSLPMGQNHQVLIPYIIYLKLRKPNLLSRLLVDDHEAHKEALQTINIWLRKVGNSGFNDFMLKAFAQLHDAHLSGDFNNIGEELGHLFQRNRNRPDTLKALAEKIDLPIDRY